MIRIETRELNPSAELIMRVKNVLGCSVAEAKSGLAGQMPLFEGEIFDNLFDELKSKIRELLSILKSASVYVVVTEDNQEITPEVLRNILNSAEQELEEMLSQQ